MLENKLTETRQFGTSAFTRAMLLGVTVATSIGYAGCGEDTSCSTDKDCKNGYECKEECTTTTDDGSSCLNCDYLTGTDAISVDTITKTTTCNHYCREKEE